MPAREHVLIGLDLERMRGIEIGALDRPIVTRDRGQIFYVDHTDTAALREKYRNDVNVKKEEIVSVDAVWGQQTLAEALGAIAPVDYVIASHVVEHVPDLIGWLEELRAILRPQGLVNLIVPDRRFTFDYLRRESQEIDVLAAHLLRARKPLTIAILDHVINYRSVDIVAAWDGKIDPAALKPVYSIREACEVAKHSLETETYHDAHCWVFTPLSFVTLMERLAENELLNFACAQFHDTERYQYEFAVSLLHCTDRAAIVKSWTDQRQRLLAQASQFDNKANKDNKNINNNKEEPSLAAALIGLAKAVVRDRWNTPSRIASYLRTSVLRHNNQL